MRQTYLIRTTGFSRSAYDEGFELFAIELDKKEARHLLGLIEQAGKMAKLDPGFKYLVLENNDGYWVSKESSPPDSVEAMEAADEEDADLILEPIKTGDESAPSRGDHLFVKPDAVFWSCTVGAGEADWIIDTKEVTKADLDRMVVELDQPEIVFK